MSKKLIEITKMPVPISLSKKKQKPSNQEIPYKIGSALQTIDNNYKSPNHKLISNMKQQLSAIKTNVEKLISDSAVQINQDIHSKNIYGQIKQESLQQKKTDEKMRIKAKQQKVKEQEKYQILNRQNQLQKMRKQKQILLQKLQKMQKQQSSLQSDLQKLKNDYKNLTNEYNKLKQQFKQKIEEYKESKNEYKSSIKKLQQKLLTQTNQKNTLILKHKLDNQVINRQSKIIQEKYEKILIDFKTAQSKLISNEQILNNLRKNQFSLKIQIQNCQARIIRDQGIISELENRLNHQYQKNNKLQQYLQQQKREQQQQQQQIYSPKHYQQKITSLEKQISSLKSKSNFQNQKQKNAIFSQIINLRNKNLQLEQLNRTLDINIKQLQSFHSSNQQFNIDQYETKIKQLILQRERIIEDYQIKLLKLENEIEEQKEINYIEKLSNNIQKHQQDTNLDHSLKRILRENQQLRNTIKQKSEEIIQLKGNLEDSKRKNDMMKREMEIQTFKFTTTQRNNKSNYQIQIQNITAQLHSQLRKYEVLQKKLHLKSNEIKKKDEFIKNVIVGKITKNSEENQIEYIKKQLDCYFPIEQQQKIINHGNKNSIISPIKY